MQSTLPAMVRIVAIDDDASDLMIIDYALQQYQDLQLVTFTDIATAAEDLRQTPADIILLDLCMPPDERFQGVARVLACAPETPVIVLTGREEIEIYSDAIQAGAHDCLCKNGISGPLLYRCIRNTLERHKLQQQLRQAACTDTLTGLPNRAAMVSELESRLASGAARNPFCLLFVDIDDFKLINDGHGHDVGDRYLVEFVQRVSQCLKPTDLLARFGGDEFVILLNDAVEDLQVSDFVSQVLDALSSPIVIEGNELFSAVSIGVVSATDRHVQYNQLLLEADTAMFVAKSRGKSRYVWFDSEMQQQALERLSFERSLRHAVDNNEFELLYQPVVQIESGQVVGFEALVRWHPPQGMVPPLKFIPVAERTGAIHRIGQWVLETACSQIKDWIALEPEVTVAVNVSPVQLEQKLFAESVLDVLHRHDVPPTRLTIEITESGAIKDFERVAQVLADLRQAGVRISVDDFGTGHSSLSQLHRLPVSEVKIDKSFIQAVEDATDYSRLFVETIQALATSIGLETVAEGIETPQQRQLLLECGYSRGQGYLFAAPMKVEEATALLARSAAGEGNLWGAPALPLAVT